MKILTREDVIPFASALAALRRRGVESGRRGEAALAHRAQAALDEGDVWAALRALVTLACGGASPPLTLVAKVLPALADWESFAFLAVSIPPGLQTALLQGLLHEKALRRELRPVALALLALHDRRALESLASVAIEAKASATDATEIALLEVASSGFVCQDPSRRAAVEAFLRDAIARGPGACLPRARERSQP